MEQALFEDLAVGHDDVAHQTVRFEEASGERNGFSLFAPKRIRRILRELHDGKDLPVSGGNRCGGLPEWDKIGGTGVRSRRKSK